MYHFTFIEETSNETENNHSTTQENEAITAAENQSKPTSFLSKTASFLHKYIDQPNCIRIFISKN